MKNSTECKKMKKSEIIELLMQSKYNKRLIKEGYYTAKEIRNDYKKQCKEYLLMWLEKFIDAGQLVL